MLILCKAFLAMEVTAKNQNPLLKSIMEANIRKIFF
jgi:hypothetical protein